MTTPNDDAPDNPVGADEITSADSPPKLRRFAPRRSRSASLPATAVGDATAPITTAGEAAPGFVVAPDAGSTVGVYTVQPEVPEANSTAPNEIDVAALSPENGVSPDITATAADPDQTGTAAPPLEDGGNASIPAAVAGNQSGEDAPAVDSLTVSPPAAPTRPSRRARSRRSPRPVTAGADLGTPAVPPQGAAGQLPPLTELQRDLMPEPGLAMEHVSVYLATDSVPERPKRIRNRSRSRAQAAKPATVEAPLIAAREAPTMAQETDGTLPAGPARPRRSHHKKKPTTIVPDSTVPTVLGVDNGAPRPEEQGQELEPTALAMLGTVPAAALAGPDATGTATLDRGLVEPLQQSLSREGADATMIAIPIPVATEVPGAALPEAVASDPAGTRGDGLYSAAEAARAADRYEAASNQEAAATRVRPGGDVGDAILAQALRELFPLLPDLSDDAPAVEEEVAQTGDIEADQQGAEPSELDADADTDAEDESGLEDDEQGELQGSDLQDSDAARRRGRRGRRGGRGRRRTGASVQPLDADGHEQQDDDDERSIAAAPGVAASASAPVSTPTPASEAEAFTPQQPPRQERSWRESGPRRPWGRTYRDAPSAGMPAPKPANGIRPGPIPQAAPPLAAIVTQPEGIAPIVPAFAMPDLRLNEPLNPGETRTERLLEAQTILLRTMIQQQALQIDVLTTAVDGLRQSVQGLAAGGARGYMPRTAIFVDAPNVVYAAENARVQLDYSRMLKYFSKDRHLVHALSYSPIIDDVREGIRYETQRFVAPFLRTGWKLITKPLKRFSDGSAKGNFDIELAVDIVTMSERLDIVVLVSGDSDFERLIQLIQSRGVRVEVVAFASNVATELVNIADVFIDIGQHLEHLRAL